MLREVLSAKCEFLDDRGAFQEWILKKKQKTYSSDELTFFLYSSIPQTVDDTPNLTFLIGKTLDFLDVVCPDNVCN